MRQSHFAGCEESSVRHDPGPGHVGHGTDRSHTDAHETYASRSLSEDLRDALGK